MFSNWITTTAILFAIAFFVGKGIGYFLSIGAM